MGLEAVMAGKTCTFLFDKETTMYRQVLMNYTAIFGSFSIPNEQR